MHVTTTLFISCVSAEFAEYRAYLLKLLDCINVRIETQESFAKELDGEPVLLELDDYIKGCDAIVHLVGSQGGSVASSTNRKALLGRYPQLLSKLELSIQSANALTYTQWEAWLALFHGKKLIIASPKPADSTPSALSGGMSQADHLDLLRTLHSRHPQLQFETPAELAISLLKFELRNLPQRVHDLLKVEKDLRDRFGRGMVDKLKARIAQLPKRSRIELHKYVIGAWVQITSQLPPVVVDDGRDPVASVVDMLAERENPLDLLALVRRLLLWCEREDGNHAVQNLKEWLNDALANCKADIETLDGHMSDAESWWDRSHDEPPRPRIEVGWQRSPASDSAVERLAFIRWGRYRTTLCSYHRTHGPWEHAVEGALQTIEELAMAHWPFERVEVLVDKAQLNHPWEYDAVGEFHCLPVVLRLRRSQFKSKARCEVPPRITKQLLACAFDDATTFQPPAQSTGAFLASWGPAAIATDSALHAAVDVAGIGIWTRCSYDAGFIGKLLEEIDGVPVEQLPEWMQSKRERCQPTEPWGHVCLLYDCKSLPPFETASDRYTAEHQRRAVMRL